MCDRRRARRVGRHRVAGARRIRPQGQSTLGGRLAIVVELLSRDALQVSERALYEEAPLDVVAGHQLVLRMRMHNLSCDARARRGRHNTRLLFLHPG